MEDCYWGHSKLWGVKSSLTQSGADARCKAGQRLSDPAVAGNSASLGWAVCLGCGASFLFPRTYLFVNMQGKNTFVWVLGEGFTISEMHSTPSFHCIQTAVPFRRAVPLCWTLQCTATAFTWASSGFTGMLRTAQTEPMGTEEFLLSLPLWQTC